MIRAKEKTACISNTLKNLTSKDSYEYVMTAFEIATEQYKDRFKPLVESTFGTILTTGGYGMIKGISSYMSEGVTTQLTDLSNKAKQAIGYNHQQTREFMFNDYLELLRNKEITPLEFFMRITSHPSNWDKQSFNAIFINSCQRINSCINNGFPINHTPYLRSSFSGFNNQESQSIREGIVLNSMSKSKSNSNPYSNSKLMQKHIEHESTISTSLKSFSIEDQIEFE
ncbi:hypothetical protein [Piscirickettsia litoralis]|uniref:Uncharacterized protein n=1 Tax=Piscirickettsia litoralis TaxID=1891921 RepID=A0ABX3A1A1_9GAMM|nr:hypothetical protein [Piscirickettsia litoralis]ODN42414.1 hypothetical protein BGC07_05045 [Piscirickettsia litoralis]